uniref:exodeoxyribonuclease III n=1 Tax=Latimeria chalumnae TaxID=7897 RepID=H3B1U9_LATCH
IITWNVKGINGPLKRYRVLSQLATLKCNIALTQKTHLTEKEAAKLNRRWVGQAYLSPTQSRGVSVLIRKQVPWVHQDTIADKEGRYIAIRIQDYTIINVYVPKTHQASFITEITRLLEEWQGEHVVVGGDFNAVLEAALERSSKPLPWDGKNSQALKSLCKEDGLYNAWRIFNPNLREYTLLISYPIMMNLQKCKIGSFTLSDHAPVCVLPPKTAKQWCFNNTLLRDSKFLGMMQEEIKEFFQSNVGGVESMSTVWDAFKACGRGRIISYTANKKERNKIRQTLEEDLEEAEHRHMLSPKDGQLFISLQLAKTTLQSHLEKQTEFALFRLRKKYFKSGDKTGTLLAHKLKKKKKNTGTHYMQSKLYTSQSKLDQLAIRDLLKKAKLPMISKEDQAILEGPLKSEEVVEAIKNLSPGKAPSNH